ncbi:DUF6538 domain-containing protein [Agrobacterium sp. DE0009]|uniref:DUF6538 domain-containing protein n=1 Tax=Agrobacterium sp. DE0009 TaxID=2587505 RepID=UPI0011A3E790|nr:DUF6538 domain-containing protein [Agrobacterium sp. DE0009]
MRKITKELANLYRNEKSGVYVFRRAIPEKYRDLAGKREFKFSLKTTDFKTALENFEAAKNAVDKMMLDLSRGKSIRESITFDESATLAKAQGRELRPLKQLLSDSAEILAAHAQWKNTSRATPEIFKSYFNAGTTDVRISELVSCYEREQAHNLVDLNIRDQKKKVAPLKLACKDLVDHLKEDKLLGSLTDNDAKTYESVLKSRIADQKIKANTANKRLVALRTLIKTYLGSKGVKKNSRQTPFDEMKFKEKRTKRVAFSVGFVRDHLLKAGALAGLNDQASNLVFALIDTGCGFKELCGLDPLDIRLDADIPHILIRPNANRTLKTDFRERTIPLVGLALTAFKNCPAGFSRYSGPTGYESASATINKFLKQNNLDEQGQCTANGLRHLFKDRLREHNIGSELQDCLMGHQTPGMSPEYGKGFSLKARLAAMNELETDFS